MALIVEDGSYVENANSLVSVNNADTYHALRGNTVWAGYTTEQKEAALIRAMDWLSLQAWGGALGKYGQALCWPRNILDPETTLLVTNYIPVKVISAQCEVALREIQNPGSIMPDVTRDSFVSEEKIDVITTKYADPTKIEISFPLVETLISGYLKQSSALKGKAWIEF